MLYMHHVSASLMPPTPVRVKACIAQVSGTKRVLKGGKFIEDSSPTALMGLNEKRGVPGE
jgi:hypothetical protein